MTEIIVETFWNEGEPSVREIRVRPVPGQLAGEYRVWCSVAQRNAATVGSLFRVAVSWVAPNGRAPYLRISTEEDWVPVTEEEAAAFIARYRRKPLSWRKGRAN